MSRISISKAFAVVLLAAAVTLQATRGQGTFQNLDFESARVILLPDGKIALTNAVPGRSAFEGTNQLSEIDYNALADPSNFQLLSSNYYPMDNGAFEVWVGGAVIISQTGEIPADAESLLFKARSTSVVMSLDGQNVSYTSILTSSRYTLYGADISAFAGQTATLSFSAGGVLDDIQFSSQPIPEPSALILLASGVLVCVLTRKRCSSQV